MKVVITGSSGYIGTALVKHLAKAGYELSLVARGCGPLIGALIGDAEALVHLAWRTDLRAAERDPHGDRMDNIWPVQDILTAARQRPGLRVVFASTSTIYGAFPDLPVTENSPDAPCSWYDMHKLEAENMLAADVATTTSLRLSNVYGGKSRSINQNRGVLNELVECAARGLPLTLYGDGEYIRDYIHIDDVCAAFQAALEHSVPGRYIVASGVGSTLKHTFNLVADAAETLTGRRPDVQNLPAPKLHEIETRNFIGKPDRFMSLTGWAPRVSLREGIMSTMQEVLA